MRAIAIDIETTGLDPWKDRVVTACIKGPRLKRSFDAPLGTDESRAGLRGSERSLLWELAESLQGTEAIRGDDSKDVLVGWNHTEFDLPFLAVRYALWGIGYMGPTTKPSGRLGKYGMPIYSGEWWGMLYWDVAYEWRDYAQERGIKWSLKPVAKQVLGDELKLEGPEVDFQKVVYDGETEPCRHPMDFGGMEHEYDLVGRPFSILDLTPEERVAYCMGDVDMTLGLFLRKDGGPGKAVLADSVSYLTE